MLSTPCRCVVVDSVLLSSVSDVMRASDDQYRESAPQQVLVVGGREVPGLTMGGHEFPGLTAGGPVGLGLPNHRTKDFSRTNTNITLCNTQIYSVFHQFQNRQLDQPELSVKITARGGI